jgi:hypothetical protein
MYSNIFQKIMTAAGVALTAITFYLLQAGCVQTAAGALSCTATTAPTWLAPYLGATAAIVGVAKLIVDGFTGKLTHATVPVTNTGAPGTVTPAQVMADLSR